MDLIRRTSAALPRDNTQQRDELWRHIQHSALDEIARLVMDGSVYPNETVQGYPLLYWALSFGDVGIGLVHLLLRMKADPNKPGVDGQTPLEICVIHNYAEAFKKLLEHGADVNGTTSSGCTILSLSIIHKRVNIALELLEHDADPDQYDSEGFNSLHHAIRQGLYLVVDRILLLHQPCMISKTAKGDHPIILAIKFQQTMILKRLISLGLDLDIVSSDNWTPLQQSILSKNLDSITLLLEARCDPNDGSVSRIPPLFLAIRMMLKSNTPTAQANLLNTSSEDAIAHLDQVFALLFKHGAKPDLIGLSTNITPLIFSIENQLSSVIPLLLKYGASPTSSTPLGSIPLHTACSQANINAAQVLLDANVDPNDADSDGNTPLHLAIGPNLYHSSDCYQVEHLDMIEKRFILVQMLLTKGAAPHKQNHLGANAIHLAVVNHDHQILSLLLKHDPLSVEIKTTLHGRNSLHEAVNSGCVACVSTILAANPDSASQDNDGKTPTHQSILLTSHIPSTLLFQMDVMHIADPNTPPESMADLSSRLKIMSMCVNHSIKQARATEHIDFLHFSVKQRAIVAAFVLSHHPSLLDAVGADGNTPLHLACYADDIDLTTILANAGADYTKRNKEGLNCLHICIRSKANRLLRVILKSRSEMPPAQDGTGTATTTQPDVHNHGSADEWKHYLTVEGHTPFCVAIQNDNLEGLDILFQEHQYLAPLCPATGIPPLHEAILQKSKALVATFLRYGAPVNCIDGEGKTALHLACLLGLRDICEILLRVPGIQVDLQDNLQRSCLHFAVSDRKTDPTKTIKDKHDLCAMLLQHGCPWDLLDTNEHTFIHNLVEANKYELIERLATICPYASYKGAKGLLQECVRLSRFEVANILLRSPDVDVNFIDGRDVSALQMATAQGRIEWVQLLIDRGAAVDLENSLGERALHFACMNGDPDIVQLLLDKGADLLKPTKSGETPLSLAEEYVFPACVKIILIRMNAASKHASKSILEHQSFENIQPHHDLHRPNANRIKGSVSGSVNADDVQLQMTCSVLSLQELTLTEPGKDPNFTLAEGTTWKSALQQAALDLGVQDAKKRTSNGDQSLDELRFLHDSGEHSNPPAGAVQRLADFIRPNESQHHESNSVHHGPVASSIIHQPQQVALLRRKIFEGIRPEPMMPQQGNQWPDIHARQLDSNLPPLDFSMLKASSQLPMAGSITHRQHTSTTRSSGHEEEAVRAGRSGSLAPLALSPRNLPIFATDKRRSSNSVVLESLADLRNGSHLITSELPSTSTPRQMLDPLPSSADLKMAHGLSDMEASKKQGRSIPRNLDPLQPNQIASPRAVTENEVLLSNRGYELVQVADRNYHSTKPQPKPPQSPPFNPNARHQTNSPRSNARVVSSRKNDIL